MQDTIPGNTAAQLLNQKSARSLYKILRELKVLDAKNVPTPHFQKQRIVLRGNGQFNVPGHKNMKGIYQKPLFTLHGIEHLRDLINAHNKVEH